MRKEIRAALSVILLAGILALAVRFAKDRSEDRKDMATAPSRACDLLYVTGGDEEGLALLRGAYTEAGTGIWDARYYGERMKEGLVLHVDAGNLSEDELRALRSSTEGSDTELELRNDPELLDQMLDNPRYDDAAVERAHAMSGAVRGYFFGTSEISTDGPCWFEAI